MGNIQFRKYKYLVIIVFSIIYIIWNLIYLDKYPLINYEDGMYSEAAWTYAKTGRFANPSCKGFAKVEESHIVYGRLFLFPNALVFRLFGVGIFQARIMSFIFSIISLFIIYKLVAELYNKGVAALSVFLISISQHFIYTSHFARPEMTLILYLLLAIYLFVIASKRSSSIFYLLSGFVFVLTCDTHLNGLSFIFIVLLLLLYYMINRKLNIRYIVYMLLGILIGILYWILIHYVPNKNIFIYQFKNYWNNATVPSLFSIDFNIINLIKNELNRYIVFFWEPKYHRNMILLAIFLLSLVYSIIKNKHNNLTIIIVIIGLMLHFLFITPIKSGGYVVILIPFFLILTSNFLYNFIFAKNFAKKIFGVIVFIVLICFNLLQIGYISYYVRNIDYNGYINKLKKIIPSGSIILGDSSWWFGFANENYYISQVLWYLSSENISEEIKNSSGKSFSDAILKRKIEYIINCGVFSSVFNNFIYETQIKPFLEKNCIKVGIVTDEFYGQSGVMQKGRYITEIYKVIKYN